jgi:hypothetical protein
MFVTYRGFKIERQARDRVDVLTKKGGRVKSLKTWTAAIEWIDQDQGQPAKGETHEPETRPQATAHFDR